MKSIFTNKKVILAVLFLYLLSAVLLLSVSCGIYTGSNEPASFEVVDDSYIDPFKTTDRMFFEPLLGEGGYEVEYPDDLSHRDDTTSTPYVKAYPSPDGKSVILHGTGEENSRIRIKGGDEVFVAIVKNGTFRIYVPLDGEFSLDISAKNGNKKRSASAIVRGIVNS